MNLFWISVLLCLVHHGPVVDSGLLANVPLKAATNQTTTSSNATAIGPSPGGVTSPIIGTRDSVANSDVTKTPPEEKAPLVNTLVPLLVATLVGIAIAVAIYRQRRGRNRSATEIDEKELVPENNRNRRRRVIVRKPSESIEVKMDTIPEETNTQSEPRFALEDGDLGLGSTSSRDQRHTQDDNGVEIRQPSRIVIDLTPLHNSVAGGSPRTRPKHDNTIRKGLETNVNKSPNRYRNINNLELLDNEHPTKPEFSEQ